MQAVSKSSKVQMSTEQLLRSHPSAPGRISSLLQELTQEVALITFCLRITFGPFHRVVGKMKVLFSSLDFTMSDDETLAGVVLPSLSPQDGLGTAHRSWHPQCGQVSALWRYCPGWVLQHRACSAALAQGHFALHPGPVLTGFVSWSMKLALRHISCFGVV